MSSNWEGRAAGMNKRKIRFLDSDRLKLIAIVTMLIDHIGAAILFPARMTGVNISDSWIDMYSLFRSIGRTAFPIFVFLLVEGFFHTHSRKKYFGRLFLFALVSEIPFDLAIYGDIVYMGSQNVFWTLTIGFLAIWGLEKLYEINRTGSKIYGKNMERSNRLMRRARNKHDWREMDRQQLIRRSDVRFSTGYPFVTGMLALILVFAGVFLASVLRVDYSIYGYLLIVLFYFGKHNQIPPLSVCIGGYLLFLWEPHCIFGFLLILLYNGTRKKRGKGFQYFFYLFYPVHLLILGLIRVAFFAG